MKAFSDLEQSKVLAEILPLESADMVIWGKDLDSIAATDAQKFMSGLKDRKMNYLPCWSLAALLSVLDFPSLTQNKEDKWEVCVPNHQSDEYVEVLASNPIDACYGMILKLHKLNLL